MATKKASEAVGSIQMRNAHTDQWHWFSDAAIERSVSTNGGPDDSMYVAVMPRDWPAEAGDFCDEQNVWFLHEQV